MAVAGRGQRHQSRLGGKAQNAEGQQHQAAKSQRKILNFQFFFKILHDYSSKSEKSNTSSMVSPK